MFLVYASMCVCMYTCLIFILYKFYKKVVLVWSWIWFKYTYKYIFYLYFIINIGSIKNITYDREFRK